MITFDKIGWTVCYDDNFDYEVDGEYDPKQFMIYNRLFGGEWNQKKLFEFLKEMYPIKLCFLSSIQIEALKVFRFWYLISETNVEIYHSDWNVDGFPLSLYYPPNTFYWFYEKLRGMPYLK